MSIAEISQELQQRANAYETKVKRLKKEAAIELKSYNKGISLKGLAIALGVVTLLDIAGLCWLASAFPEADDKTRPYLMEISKSLLQILVVAIIGSCVSVFVKGYDAYKITENGLDELRKSVLNRLHKAYTDTKRIRRLLRATAIAPPYDHDLSEQENHACLLNESKYDEQLLKLNDVQLELEILKKDIELNTDAFTKKTKALIVLNVEQMDSYLKHIVTEWEKNRGKATQAHPLALHSLPCLLAFVQPAARNFDPYFIAMYGEASQTIMDNIILRPDRQLNKQPVHSVLEVSQTDAPAPTR